MQSAGPLFFRLLEQMPAGLAVSDPPPKASTAELFSQYSGAAGAVLLGLVAAVVLALLLALFVPPRDFRR
jgi:hypothetical protein